MFAYRRWFYAAQQHTSGRQGPGDARGTRSVARLLYLHIQLEGTVLRGSRVCVLLLQDLLQSRVGVLVAETCVYLLLQYLIQSCSRGGRRIVEDMCYEIRRAEACVD
jgi:hypothetical protein